MNELVKPRPYAVVALLSLPDHKVLQEEPKPEKLSGIFEVFKVADVVPVGDTVVP